jgi:hypothetical protein
MCRQLLRGWQHLASRVAAVVYSDSVSVMTSITVNYIGALRVDVLASSDGVFSEDYLGTHNSLVNAIGLSTTGKPLAIVWTYDMPPINTADDYFGAQL